MMKQMTKRLLIVVGILVLICAGLFSGCARNDVESVSGQEKIGIIGAMDIEIELLTSKMSDFNKIEYAHLVFYEGKLCEKNVVIVKSGIGKVNAAICAQILITKFNVTNVINTGIAGGMDGSGCNQ